jgi:tetratricopeptide (TPR) repeat protein
MFRTIVLLVGGLASLSTVSLFAQEAVLAQQYGSGVHSYFTGDMMGAYETLTVAIEHGSRDPRAFYFRGLAYLKLGRPQEAAADFRKGAELESKDVNRFYNVGRALERVQGNERLELENFRVDARMAALDEAERLRKARYEALKREEDRVVREQAAAAPDKPIDGGEAARSAEEGPQDPFAVPGTPATKKPAAKTPDASDPFAAPSQKAPEKKSEKKSEKKGGLLDAIGKAAGSAATGKKATPEKKPADGADPFGGDADAKKPEAKKPEAEKKPADGADPFGASEPDAKKKPAEEKKPAEKKKGDKADPFAE